MKKWWKHEPAPADVDSGGGEGALERVNAHASVPVEVAGHPIPAAGGANGGPPGPVRDRFLQEAHHRQYGRPWAMGKYMFEFVVEAGVKPEHRVLDFGCGALRFGTWLIPYLDAGNYFGVEAHLRSLEAAVTYEIPLHDLQEKRPRLLWNEDFEVSHFGTTFDWIVDFASSTKEKEPKRRRLAFSNFAAALAPGGHYLAAPRPGLSIEEFAELGLTLVRGDVHQECPLLEGHQRFHSTNTWFEFVRS